MLTPQQQRFVAEYLIDLNGTQAAVRAGYSPKTAAVQASRLLSLIKIDEAVREGRDRKRAEAQTVLETQLNEAHVDAVRVLVELGRLATVDTRSYFDEHGNLKPLHELTPAQGASLAGFEIIKKNAAAGDGVVDTVHKIKLWDKPRALEMLAKHFGLLIEQLQVKGGLELAWKDSE